MLRAYICLIDPIDSNSWLIFHLTHCVCFRKKAEEAALYESLKEARELAKKVEEERKKSYEEERKKLKLVRVFIKFSIYWIT